MGVGIGRVIGRVPRMGYEYDVFISYRRSLPNGKPSAEREWVESMFHPELERRLTAASPWQRVAIDLQIETGAQWPDALKHQLLHSRFLVPVWSAGYFQSTWCMTEWQTMRARERVLGLSPQDAGLVLPVVFADGDFFPPDAKHTQHRKFHRHSKLKTSKSKRYEEFLADLDDLCGDIAKRIASGCPSFCAGWPIEEGKPVVPPVVPLGSLR